MRCVNVGDRMCTFLDKMWPNVQTCIDQRGHSSFSLRTLMLLMWLKLRHLTKWQIRWICDFVIFSLWVANMWKTCHLLCLMIAETFSANIGLTSPMFLWSTLITLSFVLPIESKHFLSSVITLSSFRLVPLGGSHGRDAPQKRAYVQAMQWYKSIESR